MLFINFWQHLQLTRTNIPSILISQDGYTILYIFISIILLVFLIFV